MPSNDLDDYSLYEKVAADVGGNIMFVFIGSGVIWLLTKLSVGLAKGAFWLACALVVWNLFHNLIGTVMFFIAAKKSKWVWAAQIARWVEVVFCVGALWLAAKAVGYIQNNS